MIHALIQSVEQGLATGGNEARRLFHGRGQCFDGLGFINIDFFAPVVLITLYAEPDTALWQPLLQRLSDNPAVACVLAQRRYLPRAPIETVSGKLPETTVAQEQGLEFLLSFRDKQNIGFFLDMAPGRAWLRGNADGKRVLNLFSYTCSFSVAAIAGGASSVLNVDMSKAALVVGRENHRLNQQGASMSQDVQFLPYDLFRSWGKVTRKGPYDIVIIDPPSRQKGSFIAEKDYQRVIRRLPQLMPAGGEVLACLNAPHLGEDFLSACFEQELGQAVYLARLDNRPDFPERDTQRNVKMLHYQLAPSGRSQGQ